MMTYDPLAGIPDEDFTLPAISAALERWADVAFTVLPETGDPLAAVIRETTEELLEQLASYTKAKK